MSFLKKLSNLFSGSGGQSDRNYWITVKCNRCGDVVQGRVDMHNDLSVQYNDGATTYFCRKVLMSDGGLCFQRMEVELTFDAKRNLLDRTVSGGQFVDEPSEE